MWAHGGPWIGGPLCLLWIGLIAVGIFLLVRNFRDAHRDRARSILDERYARGELSSEEYRERADHLR
ncbi:MAG: SHOCT domain-containing protein [Chloroflexota bacterium]